MELDHFKDISVRKVIERMARSLDSYDTAMFHLSSLEVCDDRTTIGSAAYML